MYEHIRIAEESKQLTKVDFKEIRHGCYHVDVEVNAHNEFFVHSGNVIADSKMNAYNKFVADEATIRDLCAQRNAHFVSCSAWDSVDTDVEFIGTIN